MGPHPPAASEMKRAFDTRPDDGKTRKGSCNLLSSPQSECLVKKRAYLSDGQEYPCKTSHRSQAPLKQTLTSIAWILVGQRGVPEIPAVLEDCHKD